MHICGTAAGGTFHTVLLQPIIRNHSLETDLRKALFPTSGKYKVRRAERFNISFLAIEEQEKTYFHSLHPRTPRPKPVFLRARKANFPFPSVF